LLPLAAGPPHHRLAFVKAVALLRFQELVAVRFAMGCDEQQAVRF